MSEKTLILQNQRHKIFFRQERIKARSQRKESCLNEVKNLSKERVPLNHQPNFAAIVRIVLWQRQDSCLPACFHPL